VRPLKGQTLEQLALVSLLLVRAALRYDGMPSMTRAVAGFRLGLLTAALCASASASSNSHAQDAFFAPDKGLHFGLSAGATLANYALLDSCNLNATLRDPLALALPLALGFGKEFLDFANGGRPSRADLAWDILGVATGLAIACVLREWLFPRQTAGPLFLLREVASKRQ
jgi:uncharacterized protein YfiM (DUF2279 family)